jgi:glucokinase
MAQRRASPRPRSTLAGGIDIGGTGIKVGIVDRRGKVRARASVETNPHQGLEAVLVRALGALSTACTAAGITVDHLACVGVGAPGAVDADHGVVLEAVNMGWRDLPLRSILRKRLGVPVSIDNDVTLAVVGENLYGAGQKANDLLGVWLGTGLGGGLILNGQVYHGHFRTAGEIGRGVVLPWAPPGAGSLEQVCSRTGIVETLERLLRSGRESLIFKLIGGDATQLREGKTKEIDSKVLAKAWRAKDPLTVEVVEHAAHVLGTAIGGTVTLLSFGRVVLGGGLTQSLGTRFLSLVRNAARKTIFPDRCRAVEIVHSELGDDAACIGAAHTALRDSGNA